MTRRDKEQINRWAAALTYYREHKPRDPRWLQRHLNETAKRFGIAIPAFRLVVIELSQEKEEHL